MLEKNKVLMIVIIVLLVVLLSAIGFLAFSLANFMKTSGMSERGGSDVSAASVLTPDDLRIVPLDKPINTNLRIGADNQSHLASISISIAVNNTDKKESPKLIDSLTVNLDVVKDICLSSIRAKTYEELSRLDGKDVLSKEILDKLKDEFKTNLIYTVYITDMYLD